MEKGEKRMMKNVGGVTWPETSSEKGSCGEVSRDMKSYWAKICDMARDSEYCKKIDLGVVLGRIVVWWHNSSEAGETPENIKKNTEYLWRREPKEDEPRGLSSVEKLEKAGTRTKMADVPIR